MITIGPAHAAMYRASGPIPVVRLSLMAMVAGAALMLIALRTDLVTVTRRMLSDQIRRGAARRLVFDSLAMRQGPVLVENVPLVETRTAGIVTLGVVHDVKLEVAGNRSDGDHHGEEHHRFIMSVVQDLSLSSEI